MRLAEIHNAELIWGPAPDSALECFQGKNCQVIVPEQRPGMLGLASCSQLKKQKVKFFYCPDTALGLLFYKAKIKRTHLFYQEDRKEGVLATPGSLYVSLLSKLHNVPIQLKLQPVPDTAKLDRDACTLSGRLMVAAEERSCAYPAEPEFIPKEVFSP